MEILQKSLDEFVADLKDRVAYADGAEIMVADSPSELVNRLDWATRDLFKAVHSYNPDGSLFGDKAAIEEACQVLSLRAFAIFRKLRRDQ